MTMRVKLLVLRAALAELVAPASFEAAEGKSGDDAESASAASDFSGTFRFYQ